MTGDPIRKLAPDVDVGDVRRERRLIQVGQKPL